MHHTVTVGLRLCSSIWKGMAKAQHVSVQSDVLRDDEHDSVYCRYHERCHLQLQLKFGILKVRCRFLAQDRYLIIYAWRITGK